MFTVNSIKGKLIAFIVVSILITSIVMVYIEYETTKKIVISYSKEKVLSYLSKDNYYINRWFEDRIREIENLKSFPRFYDLFNNYQKNRINIKTMLQTWKSGDTKNNILSILIVNNKGQILLSEPHVTLINEVPVSNCVTLFDNSRTKMLMVKNVKIPVIISCLNNLNSNFEGQMIGIVNTNAIFKDIQNITKETFTDIPFYLVFTDSKGKIIASNEQNGAKRITDIKGTEDEGFFVEGGKVIAYIYNSYIDGYIYFTTTTEYLFLPFKQIYLTFLLFIIIGTIFLSFLAYIVVSEMLQPLYSLLEGAQKVTNGQLDVHVPVQRKDEIGLFTDVFNKMVSKLSKDKEEEREFQSKITEAYSKLESLNDTLKQKNGELEKANSKLQVLSVTDGLTGLFNHRFLHEYLDKEIKRSKRDNLQLSYLMCDIDNFKTFNDTYGHQVGDMLLKELGEIIVAELRESDIAARYGGEEFGIVLPMTNREGAMQTAEKIRTKVASYSFMFSQDKTNKSEDMELHISISIGVSTLLPENIDYLSKSKLIHRADISLYEAKNRGKNMSIHYDDIPKS